MVGWPHQLNGHEFGQTPGGSEGQGSLVCCRPWGHKELDTTEQLNNSKFPHHLKISTSAHVTAITPPGGRNAGIHELLLSLGPWEIQIISLGQVTTVSSKKAGFFKIGKYLPILRNLIMTSVMNSWLVKILVNKFKENYNLNF